MKDKKLEKFLNFLLKEDNYIPEPQSSFEVRPVEDQKDISLDQVVDRYIVNYEKECIPTSDTYANGMFEEKIPSFDSILLEALNEAEDDAADSDTEDAADGSDDSGSEDGGFGGLGGGLDSATEIGSDPTKKETHNQKAVINTPQINLQEFSKNIARMINNFDTLLNPKQILLNRVENYIMTNYDQRTAQELMDMLAQNYNLSTSEREQEDKENNPTSYSVGALSSEG
jgi:hypothetical protein